MRLLESRALFECEFHSYAPYNPGVIDKSSAIAEGVGGNPIDDKLDELRLLLDEEIIPEGKPNKA